MSVTMEKGRISIGAASSPDVVLSPEEQTAADIIIGALEAAGFDISVISTDRTKEYLKLISEKYYAFCNLKLCGSSQYIELTISRKDAKLLNNDPRFKGLSVGVKRFSRIPISGASDISAFEDVILLAYSWATTKA